MRTLSFVVALAVSTCVAANLQAAVELPACFSDHMVLQRGQPIAVWGTDDPGAKVTVRLADASRETTADEQGNWRVDLPAQSAGGPHELVVEGSSQVKRQDVLIGEVWICSGQSNMEWRVRQSTNAEEEIAAANYPQIRHIKIAHRPADSPQSDVPSDGWQVASPETVADFTAVGYFFGRALHRELDVPIGLIGSNWGGTRIEPWTPPVGFRGTKGLEDIANRIDELPEKKDDGAINHQSPLALYYGMIHPLVPYSVRGAIWYQGESNNGEGMQYHDKMRALIHGWREVWDRPSMPFYFVQLAPFRYGNRDPEDLAGIWEAQIATLEVPHTGIAGTMDIATLDDIHPPNKQDVGERLARWALAHDYGKSGVVYSGPQFDEKKIEGNRIRVKFVHAEGGLRTIDGEAPSWFEIAGPDGKFIDAEAEIEGDEVVVRAPSIENPQAVRFGWKDTAEPNLTNQTGLPALPFRTK